MRRNSIIVFIVFVLLISSGCSSQTTSTESKVEEFTVHGGVKFGMKANEIIEFEANNGYLFKEEDHFQLLFPIEKNRLICYGITVAGIEDSSVYYFFDDSGAMTTCLYYRDDSYSEPFENTNVLNTLTEKYGNPISSGEDFIDIGSAFDAIELFGYRYAFRKSMGGYVSLNELYQWIEETDNGYVDIMLVMFTETFDNGKSFNNMAISYSFRTEEEVTSVLDEGKRLQDSRNNDL